MRRRRRWWALVVVVLCWAARRPSSGQLGSAVHAADTPGWVSVVLDPGLNRAAEVTWEDADGVLYWDVARNCSDSDAADAVNIIRVTEARLVDHLRELNGSCSYRVAACDLDGCSPASAPPRSAIFGSRPSAPPVVAAWPSQNELLSVRYLPPADAGGGPARAGGHQVVITNYRVELSLDAGFSAIAHVTETHDGGVLLQHIRAKKGRRYWVRVTAANAMGWGVPGVFAGGSVRCISTPGPPADLTEAVSTGHLSLRLAWRTPLDTGAWDTTEPVLEYLIQVAEAGRGFESLVAARRVHGNITSMILNRLPRVLLSVRIAAANVVGIGPFFTLGSPSAPTSLVAGEGDSGARASGVIARGVTVMALPGPPQPLYAGPCGKLTLCLVFEPPIDPGWPAFPDPAETVTAAAEARKGASALALSYRVDASLSADFTTGVVTREGAGDVGEEITAAGTEEETWRNASGIDLYSELYVRWRVTGLTKGEYYHFRVSARNAAGWGRPGVLGHPAEPASPGAGSTAGGHLGGGGVERKYLTNQQWGLPLAGAGRWDYYLASALLPCSGSLATETSLFPASLSSPLQRGCGRIEAGRQGLAEFHDALRVFLRFDSGDAQALGLDSSGDAVHASVHGDVQEDAGMVGRGARFHGGGGGVNGSVCLGGGGLLTLPNVMRRCSSSSCAGVQEERVDSWSLAIWVKQSSAPAAAASSSRQVVLALAGAAAVGTAAGTAGLGGKAMYTVAEAELALVLEHGRLVVWVKGVRYDAGRAARGPWFEGEARGVHAAHSPAGGAEGPSAVGKGGAASEWREMVTPGVWCLLAITFEAAAPGGSAGRPVASSAAAPGQEHSSVPGGTAMPLDSGARGEGVDGDDGRAGLRLSLYVNGQPLLEFVPVPEIDQDAAPLYVGGCNCTKGAGSGMPKRSSAAWDGSPSALGDAAFEPFDGSIDSFRVWSRALSPKQIARLAETGPADSGALSPHLELPFPVQVLHVPSEPAGIEAVRVWGAGALSVHVAVPSDSGDGLCVMGRKPPCCSGQSSSSICGKCRQNRTLPCPLITRYRLELDPDSTFSRPVFARDFDVPGVSRRLSYPGNANNSEVRGEVQLIAGGPEGADPMGGGLGDMQSGTLYRLEASNLPLGAWLFVRVLAANAVGWGPPQVLSLDGVAPTSVRMSDNVFMRRNQQGNFEQVGGDARHWGEL